MNALFDFMQHIYGLFGFEFHLELSTRPDNYLGTIDVWDAAEEVNYASLLFTQELTFVLQPLSN
jgi:threonyl-tRNA synthetase